MRYAIFGNAGSGKSSLARRLGIALGVTPIDLDEIFWEPDRPGVRRDAAAARDDLLLRLGERTRWVVEGCYEELIVSLIDLRPTLIWIEPGEARCLAHCRERPWEPHKYPSKEAQDKNLPMLLAWVSDYYRRDGPMSYAAHEAFFDAYGGPKRRIQAGDGSLRKLGVADDPRS